VYRRGPSRISSGPPSRAPRAWPGFRRHARGSPRGTRLTRARGFRRATHSSYGLCKKAVLDQRAFSVPAVWPRRKHPWRRWGHSEAAGSAAPAHRETPDRQKTGSRSQPHNGRQGAFLGHGLEGGRLAQKKPRAPPEPAGELSKSHFGPVQPAEGPGSGLTGIADLPKHEGITARVLRERETETKQLFLGGRHHQTGRDPRASCGGPPNLAKKKPKTQRRPRPFHRAPEGGAEATRPGPGKRGGAIQGKGPGL